LRAAEVNGLFGGHASVDRKDHAGDEGSVIGRQKGHRSSETEINNLAEWTTAVTPLV